MSEQLFSQARFASVDNARIYYQVFGHGSPLILIHGLSGSGRWWQKNIAFLARKHQVYLIDLIGFGQSRKQRFVLSKASQLLATWMDQLNIEFATVIGHSMGGLIAADLASTFPTKVERLVLVDAVAVPLERTYAQNTLGLVRALLALPLNFLPILFSDAYQAGLRTIMRAVWELLTMDISDKLAQIQVPTLIVWGENDWLVPLQIGVRIYDRLGNAQFVILEQAGHNPMWDRADTFNQIVDDFLQDRLDFVEPVSHAPA